MEGILYQLPVKPFETTEFHIFHIHVVDIIHVTIPPLQILLLPRSSLCAGRPRGWLMDPLDV